jgi:hypothetical protein
MSRVLAVNGSPRKSKGSTAVLLAAFQSGIEAAGARVEVVYPSDLEINRCDCNTMRCWFREPGVCCHKDDMVGVYARLREADTLVVATPVYVPLPGALQDLLNRLCPMMDPLVETREGRTRARVRDGFALRRVVALVTGSWWEKENADTVVRIVREVAENAGVHFAGALIRPHVELMKGPAGLTPAGAGVLEAAKEAGRRLIEDGTIPAELLEAVSRPLIYREDHAEFFNQMRERALGRPGGSRDSRR